MRTKIALLIAPVLLLGPTMPAQAQTAKLYAYNFLVEVGCTLLEPVPFACTALTPDTAVDIIRANRAILTMKYCGVGSFEGGKVALETEFAPEPQRCREILKAVGTLK